MTYSKPEMAMKRRILEGNAKLLSIKLLDSTFVSTRARGRVKVLGMVAGYGG